MILLLVEFNLHVKNLLQNIATKDQNSFSSNHTDCRHKLLVIILYAFRTKTLNSQQPLLLVKQEKSGDFVSKRGDCIANLSVLA